MTALERIYQNLQDGKVYGYMFTPCKYPYFHKVLYKTIYGHIGWNHYGSAANENTTKELAWVLEHIFRVTPEEFEQKYECRNK